MNKTSAYRLKLSSKLLTIAALGLALLATDALAGKGGKGKPGDGGDETAIYSLTDLGGFSGGNGVQSWAFGINNPVLGLVQVVGDSYISAGTPRPHHPIVWDVDDAGGLFGHQDLGLLPGAEQGTALMINDEGLIAGNDDAGRGWFASPGGNMTALPTFGGNGAHPLGMNNVGDIVGVARDVDDVQRNALWHVDLQGNVIGPVDLETFHAWDINDTGVMTGIDETDGLAAIAWFDSQMVLQRQSIGLLSSDDIVSFGLAINNAGEVAGVSRDPDGVTHAFFWSVDAGMIALGDFGGAGSHPLGMNNLGQVVGWAHNRKGDRQAFLWQDGTLSNLNEIAATGGDWSLKQAEGINDAGQIVGLGRVGKRRNVEEHGFLLTLLP